MTPTCAGCGKSVRINYQGGPATSELELFPGRKVWLCEGRQQVCLAFGGTNYVHGITQVSATCLRKAREKIALCPGCGEAGVEPGLICHECRVGIARSKEMMAERGDLRWYMLNLGSFIPYLSDMSEDKDHLRERLGRLLMQACAAGRYSDHIPDTGGTWLPKGAESGWIGCPSAEMTEVQAKALRELLELLAPLMGLYKELGVLEGRDILRQVINGEISPSELDEKTARDAELRAKLQAKLASPKKDRGNSRASRSR